MVDRIKGLGEINGQGGSAGGGLSLVKSRSDERGEREEGGRGGVQRAETMLGAVWGQGRVEEREGQAFEDFGCGAQKGDGMVAAALICRLACFKDGYDKGLLPNVRNLRPSYGEIKNIG